MSLRVALFYHSLVSDWNHGNAHFLRGVASELLARGHDVVIYEPKDGWSRQQLVLDAGTGPIEDFQRTYPDLESSEYELAEFDVAAALDGCDIALVHEWSDPALVRAVGRYRRDNQDLRVFFHDTHHRAVSAASELGKFELSDYDGILVYGRSLREAYERLGWTSGLHVWHEAADVRVFYPRKAARKDGDVVWVGNWGDEERTEELREFLIEPVKTLGLRTDVYGVRYPEPAIEELRAAGIEQRGWLPNFEVPGVFSRFRVTLHVPRRPYVRQLPGIPTIRPFEALACGIPLISAPWNDTEHLFRVGEDFLMVRDGNAMKAALRAVLNDEELASSLAQRGLETIRARHTCGHRVDELLAIYNRTTSTVRHSQVTA